MKLLSFCASRQERHMLTDYPALLSVPLSGCWIQQTVFPRCLSALLLPSLFQSSSPACHKRSRNDPEPCVFVTQPLSAARKPQFVVALQPNALHCQLVLVLWNTEGEQCTLCHCPVSVWLIKRPCTVSAGLGHWDLCWNGVIQLELYVGGVLFCFVLVQHLKWVRESPEGCWRERMGHQRSDGFRLLWSWDLPSQTTLVQWVTAAQSVKCPFSQPCSQ